jgi:hypothetical protein
MGSPGVAKLLLTFSPWLLVLLLGASIVYASQSLDLIFLRMRVAAKHREKYGSQKKGLSRRIEQKLLDPLFNAADKGVMQVSKQHRKMSKNATAFFKKMVTTSKNKNKNRW